jgi:hypothetical protein
VTYDGIFSLQGNGVTSSYSAVRANSTVELRKVLTGCDDDDVAGTDDVEDEPIVDRGSATERVLFHVVLASVRMDVFFFFTLIIKRSILLCDKRQVATEPWC